MMKTGSDICFGAVGLGAEEEEIMARVEKQAGEAVVIAERASVAAEVVVENPRGNAEMRRIIFKKEIFLKTKTKNHLKRK